MKTATVLFVLFVALAAASPAIDTRRSFHRFQIRPASQAAAPAPARKPKGDQNGSFTGEYTYIDHEGNTHSVQYLAGPSIGFTVLEDKIQPSILRRTNVPGFIRVGHDFRRVNTIPLTKSQKKTFKNIPSVEVEEIVKVHHLRNEVPATVHKTFVPETVHAMAPPPVLSRRFIIKHDVPVYNTI